jgi:hypothetical protein
LIAVPVSGEQIPPVEISMPRLLAAGLPAWDIPVDSILSFLWSLASQSIVQLSQGLGLGAGAGVTAALP